jgi:hypothetical protein
VVDGVFEAMDRLRKEGSDLDHLENRHPDAIGFSAVKVSSRDNIIGF